MKNVKESIQRDLSRFGIESTRKEKCNVCNYGTRIYITVNGKEQSHCKYCEDKKLIETLNVARSDDEKRKKLIMDKAKYFDRVPDQLSNVLLKDYITETEEQKTAKNLAANFILNFDKKRSLILSGNPGVGKTHIAVSIKKALSKDYTTLFLKSTELLAFIRQAYDGALHTEQDVFDICKDVDLLVIDDLGAEYDRGNANETWASDVIYKVLDSRLGKSTVITTNYTETGLVEKYGLNGERIRSRMFDNAETVRIIGRDRRKEKRGDS